MTDVWKPHTTVAAIIEDNGHFLMVEEISGGRQVFNQPAGHLEPDESLIEAAIRETQEETARQFIPEYITGLYHWNQPGVDRCFLRFTFYGQCHSYNENQPLDDGIVRALWMTRDDLARQPDKLRSPMVLRCIDDYLNGNRYPLALISDLNHEA